MIIRVSVRAKVAMRSFWPLASIECSLSSIHVGRLFVCSAMHSLLHGLTCRQYDRSGKLNYEECAKLYYDILLWAVSKLMSQSQFVIPAKARDYVFTGVGLSVCLSVCLLPR